MEQIGYCFYNKPESGITKVHVDECDLLFVQDTSPVDVVDKLDLTPYSSAAAAKRGQVYKLAAVTNHAGGMGGGHYVAECRSSEDDRWYICNDTSVIQQRAAGGLSEEAYMLFYRRQD